jgi:hypothetical protein
MDKQFRDWLNRALDYVYDGRDSIRESAHQRPNNIGANARTSNLAAAIYLGRTAEVAEIAKMFKGWLGDRSSYASFDYGELDWQADPSKPVGINPLGATKNGRNIDGAIADDMRRSGGFSWPPPKENYVWVALDGAIVTAELLHRQGYDAWQWSDRALLRAFTWLYEQANFPAEGDDVWQPWLANYAYGTKFPATIGDPAGKTMGWTSWTHPGSGEPAGSDADAHADAHPDADATPTPTPTPPRVQA